MSSRTPVITGVGIICAAGVGLPEVWENLRAGRSGLGPLTLFQSARYGGHLVGQVRADVERLAGRVRGSRTDKLAWIAAQQAVEEAGLQTDQVQVERMGVSVGSTVGGMMGTERSVGLLLRERKHRFGVFRFHECAGAAELCANRLGWRGPCLTVSTACSAGAMALGVAADMLASGEADCMLAGGADSLCRLTLNGFGSLLLLDAQGCRPFDAHRAGISLGEGAAMLVLETEEHALARGARILARLAGWGASCDAFHATAPDPEGRGALLAMRRAAADAGLEPEQIDFVSAHGTGTSDNDAMEARALRELFGSRVPAVASVMRFFGHTLAASGALKAAVAVKSLHEQAIPGNLGLGETDPQLGIEPVREFRPQLISHLLSNSFGFGGNNVALVFSRWSKPLSAPSASARPVSRRFAAGRLAIAGAGFVSAAGTSMAQLAAAFERSRELTSEVEVPIAREGRVRAFAVGDFGAENMIEPTKRRRLSRIQQMALVAARQAVGNQSAPGPAADRMCVALGTGLGSLNDTAAFVENLILKDERAPRPAFFTNSVHNALASQVALELGFTGPNLTFVQREISFECALWHGANQLRNNASDGALVGAADELNQYVLGAGLRWKWWAAAAESLEPFVNLPAPRQRPLPGEACAVFALAREGRGGAPLAWVSGVRVGRWQERPGQAVDAEAEAHWVAERLAREGVSLSEVDLVLTGANGFAPLDDNYRAVVEAFSRLAGSRIPLGAYKQGCGELPSASAVGFLTAVGLVRGQIAPALCVGTGERSALRGGLCRTVVLYTLSLSGNKGMCCVHA